MSTNNDIRAKTRSAGEIIFVAVALGFSLVLLSQITNQTVWVDSTKSFAGQPRFWPAVALISMTVSLTIYFLRLRRRRPQPRDWSEARRWLEPLEYALWFMAFVFLVPIVGFLPMGILFSMGLTWRIGYRDRSYLLIAAMFAVCTVIFFKGLLGVKIPGALIYEVLPTTLRSFFILYL